MKLMRSIKAKLLGKGKNVIIYSETETSLASWLFLPLCCPFLRFSSSLTGTTKGKLMFFYVIIRDFLRWVVNS